MDKSKTVVKGGQSVTYVYITMAIAILIAGFFIWRYYDDGKDNGDNSDDVVVVDEKKDVIIKFEPSKSPDVIGYRFYYETSPSQVSYNSNNVDLGNKTEFNLRDYIKKKGIYNIGIVSIDKVGNLSKMRLSNNIEM